MRLSFNCAILEISEKTRVMRAFKDANGESQTERESLGYYARLDTTPEFSIWVGNAKPEKLKVGPCKIVIEQEDAP